MRDLFGVAFSLTTILPCVKDLAVQF